MSLKGRVLSAPISRDSQRRCDYLSAPAATKGITLSTQPPRLLFLGSFPPRECGIATFMKDVIDSVDDQLGTRSAVIAIDEPAAE